MGLDVSWAIMEERSEQNASSHKQQEVSSASEGSRGRRPLRLQLDVPIYSACVKSIFLNVGVV